MALKLNPPVKFTEEVLEELKTTSQEGEVIPESIVEEFSYQSLNQE